MQEFVELTEEGGDDPWWRTAYPTLGVNLGMGFEYREIKTGCTWTIVSADRQRADEVQLIRSDPSFETRNVPVFWMNTYFDFVACHHDAGCCRIHETHSQVHNGCFLPARPKQRLPLAVGDEYDVDATGECFVITGLRSDGRVTMGPLQMPLDYGATFVLTRDELEQGYEYAQGHDYCACDSPGAVCPIHPAPASRPARKCPGCDHGEHCCTVHDTHVRPHLGCSLRLL